MKRATILIGKEMGEIRGSLKSFSKSLRKIFDENKSIVESSKSILFIKSKLTQLQKEDKELQEISNETISINNKISEKEKTSKEIIEEIDVAKKSPEYMKKQEIQERIRILKSELEKDILGLWQAIDFKALGNFYHIFEDKIQIVNDHRDYFKENFEKDGGKAILKLLDEAKLNNKNISEKFDEISRKKEEELKLETEFESEKNKDKTVQLHSDSTKIILEIGDLKNKVSREEKRIEKIKEEKEKITREIKESLQKFGVELS